MMSSRRVIEVAGERVLDADERFEGYRSSLVRMLVQSIQLQDKEGSERSRRDEIAKMVDALATQVRARRGSA